MAQVLDEISRRAVFKIGIGAIAVTAVSPITLALPTPSPKLTTGRVKIQTIIDVVARSLGIKIEEMLSPERTRRVVEPRQIGMYLTYRFSGRSLPEIGRRFGGRDHTTVLYAARKIARPLPQHEKLAARARALIPKIERELAKQGQAIDWSLVRSDSDISKGDRHLDPAFATAL